MLEDAEGSDLDIVASNLEQDANETTISTKTDFICFQNVKDRMRALVLLLKLTLDKDREFQHFVIDGGRWDMIKIFPQEFLRNGND